MKVAKEIVKELKERGIERDESVIEEALSTGFYHECAKISGLSVKDWVVSALSGEF